MAPPRRTGATAYGQAATRSRPTRPIAAPPAPGSADRRKYTVRIDTAAAERFERAVLTLSTEVGRKLDKSEVMRELAEALTEDSDLFKAIVSRLRRH